MKCLTWNLEWASPASKRLSLIKQKISEIGPDVVCYTEVIRSVLPDGHTVEANADYGYLNTGERRKVILWSKNAWTKVDTLGDPEMPSGRFVSGVTGGIRFVGVCIPWKDAHVKTGRKDRTPWQDHLCYCENLGRLLNRYSMSGEPVCILGDFNQRIPRVTQPVHVAGSLLEAIPDTFSIITEGMKDSDGQTLIDHFAVSASLAAQITAILPRFTSDGTRLSDHIGVMAHIEKSKVEQHQSSTEPNWPLPSPSLLDPLLIQSS